MRAVKLNHENSSVANHVLETGHHFSIDNLEVLYSLNKSKKMNVLDILEGYFIKESLLLQPGNVLNEQTELINSPIINPSLVKTVFPDKP